MVRWFRGLNDEILALYPRIDNTPLCLPSVAGQAPSKRGESIRALFLPINYSTVFALYFAPWRLIFTSAVWFYPCESVSSAQSVFHSLKISCA